MKRNHKPIKAKAYVVTIDELEGMKDSATVIVSRVKLNERIFECQFNSNQKDQKVENILLKAAENLSKQDEKQSNLAWGTRMTVKEAKIAFANDRKSIIGKAFKFA